MDNSALDNIKRRKSRKDSQLTKIDSEIFELGQMYSDVLPCIHFLTLIGAFAVKNREAGKKRMFYYLFRKLTAIIMHTFWLYVFFISFLSTIRLSRQFKTNFTLSLGSTLVAIIRFAVHWKMHKVESVVQSIEIFYLSITKTGYRSKKCTIRSICYGGTVAALIMCGISIKHFKVSGMFNTFTREFVFGLNLSNDTSPFFQYIPAILFTCTVFYHHFIPLIVSLYIISVFFILRNAIGKFVENLKYDRLEGVPDLTLYTLKFNRMLDIIAEVEELLGVAIFFLFGCLMTNQLCVMNSILGGNNVDHPASLMMEFVISIKNIVIFFSLTLFGASVTEQIENVADELRKMVTVPGQDFEKLSLLLQSVNNSKVSVTAWKIFTLKRSLFLTTLSVMTTYGMLLMQIAQQTRN